MLKFVKFALALSLMSGAALAEGLEKVPRPLPNPRLGSQEVLAPANAAAVADGAAVAGLRPRLRPAALEGQVAALRGAAAAAAAAPKGLDLMGLRPKARPDDLVQDMAALDAGAEATAVAPKRAAAGTSPSVAPPEDDAAPQATSFSKKASSKAESKSKGKTKQKEPVSTKGSVCGVPGIKGAQIAPIKSKVAGCGLPDGVRVTSVSGVRLSMAVTIDCPTAKALNRWVETQLQPAYGGQVVQLRIAGHYICRPRNNVRGAKVSEHGRGKAVDIAGIVLANGKTRMVAGGFDQTMRKAHRGACGIFGTTLGPGSDGYHEDHMHFDTASNRRPYCR